MSARRLTYLAVPYSHDDPKVRRSRFEAANRAAGKLVRDGRYVFSPISHTHPIAETCDLPVGWDYWEGYDSFMLSLCSRMVVLMLPGWWHSVGLAREMEIAKTSGIKIEYMREDLTMQD